MLFFSTAELDSNVLLLDLKSAISAPSYFHRVVEWESWESTVPGVSHDHFLHRKVTDSWSISEAWIASWIMNAKYKRLCQKIHEGSPNGFRMRMMWFALAFTFAVISARPNVRGRFRSDMFDSAFHRRQSTKWGEVFQKSSEIWRISGRELWSCLDTSLSDLMFIFPSWSHPIWICFSVIF